MLVPSFRVFARAPEGTLRLLPALALSCLLATGCTRQESRVNETKEDTRQREMGASRPAALNKPVPAEQAVQPGRTAAKVQNETEREGTPARPSVQNDTTNKRIEAEAKFVAGPGIKLRGEAELEEVAGGVQIKVEVDDAPAGLKGIHIHQKGDCSDIPGKSMGEHLTAAEEKHGLPGAPEHHTGDMGNINVEKDGEGKLTFVVPGVHLEGQDERSLANRAIVIHEAKDIGTGKSGESGKPIACAVIRPS